MNSNIDDEDNGSTLLSFLPQEAMYAHDTDFLTTNENEKDIITDKIREILPRDNLKVNNSKSEQMEIFRGDGNIVSIGGLLKT